jgi:hypothetical protein
MVVGDNKGKEYAACCSNKTEIRTEISSELFLGNNGILWCHTPEDCGMNVTSFSEEQILSNQRTRI